MLVLLEVQFLLPFAHERKAFQFVPREIIRTRTRSTTTVVKTPTFFSEFSTGERVYEETIAMKTDERERETGEWLTENVGWIEVRARLLLDEPILLMVVFVGIDVQNQRERKEYQRDNGVESRSLVIVVVKRCQAPKHYLRIWLSIYCTLDRTAL